MTRRRLLAGALVLLALTVLLAFLFNRTQALDIEGENRIMLDLREFEKLDAEWNVNILRSHIGANPDYDPLGAGLPRMHLLLERLERALPDAPAARQAHATLGRNLKEKEELVEQFKTYNAILRNSLLYFPGAVSLLKTELIGVRGAERLDAPHQELGDERLAAYASLFFEQPVKRFVCRDTGFRAKVVPEGIDDDFHFDVLSKSGPHFSSFFGIQSPGLTASIALGHMAASQLA